MNLKSRLHINKFNLLNYKKGYLQIDFAFVALIFFILFFIIYAFYDSYNINLDNDLNNKEFNQNSKDICYLFISTSGNPQNWELEISNLKTIGLKNISSNSIDANKLAVLNSSNYFTIIDKLYLNSSYVNIKIVGLKTNSTYLNFGDQGKIVVFQDYTCYSNYNGEEVKVTVEVWE